MGRNRKNGGLAAWGETGSICSDWIKNILYSLSLRFNFQVVDLPDVGHPEKRGSVFSALERRYPRSGNTELVVYSLGIYAQGSQISIFEAFEVWTKDLVLVFQK